MSDKVVDLVSVRLTREIDKAQKAASPYEQVQLIGCTNCESLEFALAHDGRIICNKCRVCIEPLQWFDMTRKPPAA